MKITDVSLTLFAWDSIPPTSYGQHSARPTGKSDLGLLRVQTDEGVNYEVHHGGNSLNNVANLHVIMAIRDTELFEVPLPDAMQKYGLAEDITPDKDGMVHAPTGPGLGGAIDFELVERKRVGVLT